MTRFMLIALFLLAPVLPLTASEPVPAGSLALSKTAASPAVAPEAKKKAKKAKKVKQAKKVYVCPMHPEVTSDKPGSCPKCHMDLVEKK